MFENDFSDIYKRDNQKKKSNIFNIPARQADKARQSVRVIEIFRYIYILNKYVFANAKVFPLNIFIRIKISKQIQKEFKEGNVKLKKFYFLSLETKIFIIRDKVIFFLSEI